MPERSQEQAIARFGQRLPHKDQWEIAGERSRTSIRRKEYKHKHRTLSRGHEIWLEYQMRHLSSDEPFGPLKVHHLLNGRKKDEDAATLAERVNLPADLLDRYPSALSGGQRQRIAISRAISLDPEFIVADEAVASLDLIGQVQVMELFNRLKKTREPVFS